MFDRVLDTPLVKLLKHHIFNPFGPKVLFSPKIFGFLTFLLDIEIEHLAKMGASTSCKLHWKLCEQRKANKIKMHILKMMRFIITACCYLRKNGSIVVLKFHSDIVIIIFLHCCLRKSKHSIISVQEIYQPFASPRVVLYRMKDPQVNFDLDFYYQGSI